MLFVFAFAFWSMVLFRALDLCLDVLAMKQTYNAYAKPGLGIPTGMTPKEWDKPCIRKEMLQEAVVAADMSALVRFVSPIIAGTASTTRPAGELDCGLQPGLPDEAPKKPVLSQSELFRLQRPRKPCKTPALSKRSLDRARSMARPISRATPAAKATPRRSTIRALLEADDRHTAQLQDDALMGMVEAQITMACLPTRATSGQCKI